MSRVGNVRAGIWKPLLGGAALVALASGAVSLAMRWEGAPATSADVRAANASLPKAAGSTAGVPRQQLLERWTPHVERVYGVSGQKWQAAMSSTLRRATDLQVAQALAEPEFDGMLRVLDGGPAVHQSSVAPAGAAAPVGGLNYNVVTPCRVLDTRNNGSRVLARTSIEVHVTGSDFLAQGGAAHDCGVPVGARAVAVNLTAVAPAGPGFLTAYPSGGELPRSSSLNYLAGATRANEVLVRLGDGAPPSFSVYSQDDVDVVVDVVGFFAAPPEETMGCTRVTEFFSLDAGYYTTGFAECPQGLQGERWSQRMGGACDWVMDSPGQPEPGLLSGSLSSWNWMQCDAENKSSVKRTFRVVALCCSVQPLP